MPLLWVSPSSPVSLLVERSLLSQSGRREADSGMKCRSWRLWLGQTTFTQGPEEDRLGEDTHSVPYKHVTRALMTTGREGQRLLSGTTSFASLCTQLQKKGSNNMVLLLVLRREIRM